MSDEYDAIHDLVIQDPEAVWDRVRRFLCEEQPERQLERVDLVEDLMFWHSDAFIDRVEALAEECPGVRDLVGEAHVGGTAETPGLTRFYDLQDRVRGEPWTLRAEGPGTT